MLCSSSPRTRVPSGALVLRNSRQRDMPARLAKLRQRDMPARPALTACDLDWERDSWQCGGRQCRRWIAFVLLEMIVV